MITITRDRLGSLRALAVLLVTIASLATAHPAHAEFGLSSLTMGFQDPAGAPVTQAGARADLAMDMTFATVFNPVFARPVPDGQLKDVQVDLPAGFYGNPQAVPTCPYGQFATSVADNCSPASQVGVLTVQIGPNPLQALVAGVYNVPAGRGQTAVLMASVVRAPIYIVISPRTDGDYGLRATISNVSQAVPFYRTSLVLWGVPADPAHDAARYAADGSPGAISGLPARPFITLPGRCDPVTTDVRVRSWQEPDRWVGDSWTSPKLTGCDALRFSAAIKARPQVRRPDTPSALDVDLDVPQDESPGGVGTPPLEKAVVTLPAGMAISPASAQGLSACSDEEMALGTKDEPSCPDASKIGTVSIKTPLLPDPLEGDIVLGTPKPGQLFRLFLVAHGPGLLLKLPGVAQPDPVTGQLTTTFEDTPQLPFSNLHLHFKGGDRAPLATPQTCGTKTTTAELTPWGGGAAVTPTDSFDITGCTGGFAPSFEAGTVNPAAGAFSAFTMTIRRNDGDQELSGISVNLPPGLLGILAGVPVCPEAQAAAGTCDASTQLGTTTVEAGSGDQPLPLTGKVFLAGPYKGAPYSLSIAVNAIAGPFDLGTVVVRAPLNIDAAGGKVAVPADPLPTILQGVPLRLRTVNVTLDRPGFMFNATNCTPMAVGATLTSVNGTTVTPSSRYQALGCADLPLKPKFSMRLSGRYNMKKLGHPGVVANLSQTPGQAGLRSVRVALPAGLSVDLRNLASICKADDAAARKCAAAAIVGKASAKTPALPGELSGPVYLVEGVSKDPVTGKVTSGLPKLWLKLEGGGVPLDLWANSSIVGGRVITTFPTIPDAPISSFRLQINGGSKGILQTGRDLCRESRTSKVKFDGQNGRVVRRTIRVAGDCAPRIAKTRVAGSRVSLTVSGIGAGRLSVTGSGVRKAARSIKSADVATIATRLSAAGKRRLSREGSVRVRLTVVYKPATGRATTLRKSVIIRRSGT